MLKTFIGDPENIPLPETRLWALVYGFPKSRKTSTAVTWPGPLWIAELDCDEDRLRYVLAKHAPGKEANYDIILPRSQTGLTEAELEDLVGRTELVIRAAKSAGEGTLIIDGGTALYRWYQILYTGYDFSAGKPAGLKGRESQSARANFALITQHFDQLLKPMRDIPTLSTVVATEAREVWSGGEGTGKYEPKGPDSWEFTFDIEIMTYVEGGEYDPIMGTHSEVKGYGYINWCAYQDGRMRGKRIPDVSYEKIMSLLK